MKIIENQLFDNKRLVEADHDILIVRKCTFRNSDVFCDIRRCEKVLFRGCVWVPGDFTFSKKYVCGVRLGYSGKPEDGNGIVVFVDCCMDSFGEPSSDYSTYNRDAICVERGNGAVYVDECGFQGATDAILDCKSPVYVKNSFLGRSYRQIRIWSGVVVTHFCNEFAEGAGVNKFWYENEDSLLIAADMEIPKIEVETPKKINFVSSYFHVLVNDVVVSNHNDIKEAWQNAVNLYLANSDKKVTLTWDGGRVE